MSLLQWPVRKIHGHRDDVARVEAHADKLAAFTIYPKRRRRASRFALGFFGLGQKTLGDQASDVGSDGRGRDLKVARQGDAGEARMRANPLEDFSLNGGGVSHVEFHSESFYCKLMDPDRLRR